MINAKYMMKALGLAGLMSAAFSLNAAVAVAHNAAEIQKALDAGDDVALVKGKVYDITNPILFKRDGQKIFTKDAKRLGEYATLRVSKKEAGQIINGNNKNDILLEKVILDGNRYGLPPYVPNAEGNLQQGDPEMAFFGGGTARNQTIRNCVFMNSRTWSTFKFHEGGNGCTVENSVYIGGGADCRGNGRHRDEKTLRWGDGISCAAANSTVKNNIIIDPTDVGVVVFCAPGTQVLDNVIASVSRESLGGVNMVDGIGHHEIDKDLVDPDEKKAVRRYNYRDVLVQGNLIDAIGARIHIAIPMGANVWVPSDRYKKIFIGATVRDNTLSGDALAYGLVMDGVEEFTVEGNKSVGRHSGLADGRWDVICDEPGPFLYNPEWVKDSKLQKDFVKQERSLQHLLRCNHGTRSNTPPYRDIYKAYAYGQYEAPAAVKTAFLEMLGRDPTKEELKLYSAYLNERVMPVEDLRYRLMDTEEFKAANPGVGRNDLHNWRAKKWLDALDKAMGTSDKWKARDVYSQVLKSFKTSKK